MLMDMGAEYQCYCSDITCSYPANGRFTPAQRMVYEGVLLAQQWVMEAMRPGVSWRAMHLLAWEAILTALTAGGLLRGSVSEMMEAGLGQTFCPCGLGHLIGCDTHDVGGYLSHCPPRGPEPGLDKLRMARELEEGMCLTVEPGIYFMDVLLDAALADPVKSKFMVAEEIDKFRTFGGVRLEDVVTVTESGIINYTLTPRTVDEVEAVMGGGDWPPQVDQALWLCRAWGYLDNETGCIVDAPLCPMP